MDPESEPNFGDLPAGLEDLEMIAHSDWFSVAATFDCPEPARSELLAVAVARRLGLKSIDYTRRAYVDSRDVRRGQRDARQADAIAITREAKQAVRTAIERAMTIRDKPGHVGMFAAGAALARLPITFRMATLAVRNGFHFEGNLLTRMILEQLAWMAAVHTLADDSLFDVAPQACIPALKAYFPYAGRTYGLLSKAAHIVPSTTLRYIDFPESGKPMITLKSFEYARDDAFNILLVADMYAVMSEVIFVRQRSGFTHISLTEDGAITLRSDRPVLQRLRHWERVLAEDSREGSA